MDIFFTQEMSDFSKRTTLLNNNVDGEVSMCRPHLIGEAQCNALDHVLYTTTDRENIASSFLVPQHLSTQNPFSFQGD